VLIHPSTALEKESTWVVYNEFVLTTKSFIRTVTHIRPEWLLDIAPGYYDVGSFAKGPVRTELERTMERVRKKNALRRR